MAQPDKKKKPVPPRKRHSLFGSVRTNFLTGLAVVLPIGLTIYLVWSFMGFVDARVLPFIPERYNPSTYVDIRGFGLVVFLIFTTFVGALTKGLFGRSIVRMAESIVDRMPVVRSIYNGLKQIVETVFSQKSKSFEKACLVEYPRKGIWAIAFVSTEAGGEVKERAGEEEEILSVFLPTTPNPTSGFLLFVPKSEVIILDMDVEEAAKLIISAGLVIPPTKEEKARAKARAARVRPNSAAKGKAVAKPKTTAG